ncbi:hypothetical protein [Kytococcus schroeteri]|uniref:hypothetical protein n=1 Tax=Kytococcus schroeteri TaxID=138300 RepID=UPI0011449CC0|nr:hypothetical protein [Kytococcus schroeteri]
MRTLRIAAAAAALATGLAGTATTAAQADSSWKEADVWHIKNAGPVRSNLLNDKPVCNAWEQYRTHITEVRTSFTPVGAIQTTNLSDKPIPLTQDLSATQSFTLKLDGDFSRSFTVGGTGSGDNGSGEIAATWTQAIQPGFSYTMSWTTGQTIGPVDVKPGYAARATYGFNTVSFKGTQQYCKLNGTWSQPTPVSGTAPTAKDVRVEQYADGELPESRY